MPRAGFLPNNSLSLANASNERIDWPTEGQFITRAVCYRAVIISDPGIRDKHLMRIFISEIGATRVRGGVRVSENKFQPLRARKDNSLYLKLYIKTFTMNGAGWGSHYPYAKGGLKRNFRRHMLNTFRDRNFVLSLILIFLFPALFANIRLSHAQTEVHKEYYDVCTYST